MEFIVRKNHGDHAKEDKAERLKIENLVPISTNRTFISVEKLLGSEENSNKDTYCIKPEINKEIGNSEWRVSNPVRYPHLESQQIVSQGLR